MYVQFNFWAWLIKFSIYGLIYWWSHSYVPEQNVVFKKKRYKFREFVIEFFQMNRTVSKPVNGFDKNTTEKSE